MKKNKKNLENNKNKLKQRWKKHKQIKRESNFFLNNHKFYF